MAGLRSGDSAATSSSGSHHVNCEIYFGGSQCTCTTSSSFSESWTSSATAAPPTADISKSSTHQRLLFPDPPDIPPHSADGLQFELEGLGDNDSGDPENQRRYASQSENYARNLPFIISEGSTHHPDVSAYQGYPGPSYRLSIQGPEELATSFPSRPDSSDVANSLRHSADPYRAFMNSLPAQPGPTQGTQCRWLQDDRSSMRSQEVVEYRGNLTQPLQWVPGGQFTQFNHGGGSSVLTGSDIGDSHSAASGTGSKKKEQCSICEKWLADKDGLRRHVKTHDPTHKAEYREVCLECDARFKNPKDLDRHMSKHTGERPFTCTYSGCQDRFKRRDHAKRHVHKVHGIPTLSSGLYVDYDPSDPSEPF